MNIRSLAVLSFIAAAPALAGSSITLDVRPSSAPNAFGSPSWNGYAANALNALQNGLTTLGDRNTDPTGYTAFPNGSFISPGDMMVTSYSSWRGIANQASPFSSELGNRLHFGLHAYGDGTQEFTLADVAFNMTSSDGILDFAGNLAGTFLDGINRIGVNWGPDNAPGGGDDIVYNSGEDDTVLLDELMYRGIGNAFWPGGGDPDPSNPLLGQQGAIDDVEAYFAQQYPFQFATTYTILTYTGSGNVQVTPTPGALALLGLGGLIVGRRRR